MGRWQPIDTSDSLQLYEQGKTCQDIGAILGYSYATVYLHLKEAGQKFRGRLKEVAIVIDAFEIGYVIGVLLGDGSLTRNGYRIQLKTVDREFAERFCEALNKVFIDLNVGVVRREDKKCKNGEIFEAVGQSMTVYAFLKSRVSVAWCRLQSLQAKQGILLGLWDSEGSITFTRPSYPLVRFEVHDSSLAMLYTDLLAEIVDIRVNICGPSTGGGYYTSLYGRDRARKFYEAVNPTIDRKCERFEGVLA